MVVYWYYGPDFVIEYWDFPFCAGLGLMPGESEWMVPNGPGDWRTD
jgi:hypothetical protein